MTEVFEKTSPRTCANGAGRKTVLASLAAVTVVSVCLSSLATFLCVLFAGAGHAAASPGLTYFAPVWALPELVELTPHARRAYVNWGAAIMSGYYCLYGIGISVGRFKGRGKLALTSVLVLHYAGLAICMSSYSWDGIQNIWILSNRYGAWITIVLVELFVLLHVLAFQYAWSEIPYRPKFRKSAMITLVTGLIAGILFHVLTIMQAPQGT